MNSRTKAKIERNQKAVAAFAEHAKTYAGYKKLEDKITLFGEQHKPIMKGAQDELKTSEGLTDDKQKAYDEVILQTLPVARKGFIWAKDAKKTELMPKLDLVKDDFVKAGAFASIGLARNVEETLRPFLAELVEDRITAVMLDGIRASTDTLEILNPLPRKKRGDGKSEGADLTMKMKVQSDLLTDIRGLIEAEYSVTDTLMVNKILASMRIDDPITRKTALLFDIVDEKGNPVTGAYVDVEEMVDEEQYSDAFGQGEIPGMKSGKMILTVSKDGLVTQKVPFEIKRGQRLKIKVVMKGV